MYQLDQSPVSDPKLARSQRTRLDTAIDFGVCAGTHVEVSSIRQTNLHSHPGAIEIVYVLRGRLHVQVSFEEFDLEAGDYVVVNQNDPHHLTGSDDNATALVHMNLDFYAEVDPFVNDVILACESFDLARYRGQESVMRAMLLDIITGSLDPSTTHAPTDATTEAVQSRSRALMHLLCSSYTLANYYHRGADPTPEQRNRFHSVVRYLTEHGDERDVLGQLAAAQHYSKSRVSHLIKDVSAISFTDLLTFLRVARAERLLLDGVSTMVEVAAACGFSDVKYLTRAFADWFHTSPGDYRRHMQRKVLLPNDIAVFDPDAARTLVASHRDRLTTPPGRSRLSITPLLLKNVGSRLDLFESFRANSDSAAGHGEPVADPTRAHPPHLVPLQVDVASLDQRSLIYGLHSFDQIAATPCLVVRFAGKANSCADLDSLQARLIEADCADVTIWLLYTAMSDRHAVDEVVTHAHEHLGMRVQPILQP